MAVQNRSTELLIVGQGITGTALSFSLLQHKIPHIVIDPGEALTASKLAAGIINPVTGRNLTLNYGIKEMYPVATAMYGELELLLEARFFHKCGLYAIFPDQEIKQAWTERLQDTIYRPWINPEFTDPGVPANTLSPLGAVCLPDAVRVNTELMLSCYRSYLWDHDMLLSESFDHNLLQRNRTHLEYNGIRCAKVIFCEGHLASSNPWFRNLPFRPNRGQRFLIRTSSYDHTFILRKYGLLAPTGKKGQYWFGATNEWNAMEPGVTEEGRMSLISNLDRTLKGEWDLEDHKGAIRPTMRDRKPVAGFLAKEPRIGILNGMGTKGALLAPYYARAMAAQCAEGVGLPEPVRLSRFTKKNET